MFKLRFILFFVVATYIRLSSFGQAQYNRQVYTVYEGLPSSDVNNIFQDSKKFLWVSTDAGLSRFDGHEFVNFSATNGLFGSLVLVVAEDMDHTIWTATTDGLFILKNGKFEKIEFDFGVINCIGFLNKSVFVGTKKGLFTFEKNGKQKPLVKCISKDKITCFHSIKGNKLLIGTNEKLVIFDGGLSLKDYWKPDTSQYIFGISETKYGEIWFGTLSGKVYRINNGSPILIEEESKPENSQWKNISQTFKPQHSNYTGSINTDNEGLVYVTHEKQVNIYRDGKLINVVSCVPENNKEGFVIRSIIDNDGNIWCTSLEGLVVLRPSNVEVIATPLNSVYAVFKLPDERPTYFSDGHGIYYFENGKLLRKFKAIPEFGDALIFFDKTPDNAYVLASKYNSYTINKKGKLLDRSSAVPGKHFGFKRIGQTLYIGGSNKLYSFQKDTFKRLDNNNLTYQNINIFCVDSLSKNELIIGTTYGLFLMRGNNFIHIDMPYKNQKIDVFDISDLGNGFKILSTFGYGVLVAKIQGDKMQVIKSFTTDNGLGSNFITSTLVDNRSKAVWVLAKNGVYKITNIETKPKIVYLSVDDGMTPNDWNSGNMVFDSDSTILITGTAGLSHVNRNSSFDAKFCEVTNILSIKVNGKSICLEQNDSNNIFTNSNSQEFTFEQNSFEFYYTGINLSRPTRVKYEYFLEGYEKNPLSTTYGHIYYPNLPPGNYSFKVRSTTAQTFTSEKFTTFSFIINKPYWQTTWFRFISFALLLGSITLLYRLRLKYKLAESQKEIRVTKKINETKLLAFQARMNPHFIFNSLNSIQYFVLHGEKLATLNYLSKFGKLLRQILDNSLETKISLEDEITMLKSYVEMEQLRFEDKFEYEIEIATDVIPSAIYIPGMIIQPFVENAILHGLLHRKTKGKLNLYFKIEGSQIICEIIDNGVGRAESEKLNNRKSANHRSHGTTIAISRLQLFNDSKKNLVNSVEFTDCITEGKPNGTKVKIVLPII